MSVDIPTIQRSEFNKAVGDSINSDHKMCTNEEYKMGEYSLQTRAHVLRVSLPKLSSYTQTCNFGNVEV